MNVRWFYNRTVQWFLIVVVLGLGFAVNLAGQSDTNVPASTLRQPDGAQLPAVRLDGNYFSRGGHRFIPMGANWVPAKAAMEWPYDWDPKAIEADFARMHELGFNTIRARSGVGVV